MVRRRLLVALTYYSISYSDPYVARTEALDLAIASSPRNSAVSR